MMGQLDAVKAFIAARPGIQKTLGPHGITVNAIIPGTILTPAIADYMEVLKKQHGWGDDPEVVAYAIFGQRADGEAVLRDGDRVELLRPLVADPKEARRQRVEERRRLPKK